MDLVPLLLATGVPALVAFVATLVLPRLWRREDEWPVTAVWLLSALAATVGILALGGIDVAGATTPLILPGGLAAVLVVLAALPPLARVRGREPGTLAIVLSALIATIAVGLLSFPWWDRDLVGWLVLAGSGLVAVTLVLGVELAAPGHRSRTLLWAALAAGCAPFLSMLAAVTHAQVVALSLAPVAGAAVAGFVGGARLFRIRGAVLPAVLIAALIANGVMRYVPGSEDSERVVWTLRLAPLALLLAPWAIVGLRRVIPGKLGAVAGILTAVLVLAAGVAAAQWAYSWQDPEATEDTGGYDASNYRNISW